MRFAIFLSMVAVAADDPLGSQIYKKHCASCHDAAGNNRIPPQAALRQMSSAAILKAMEVGVMKAQSAAMGRSERRAVSAWLGKAGASSIAADRLKNRCATSVKPAVGGEWTSWGGASNLRYQTSPGLSAADIPKLKLKWAFGVPDATVIRSQPAVANGRVYFGTQEGVIYSLDASTGCTYWATEVTSQVRSGIVIANGSVFAGDVSGHIYSINAITGVPNWQVKADQHPATMVTSTPAYHDGKLFIGVASYEEAIAVTPGYACCTFRGSAMALDAATGKVLWKTYTIADAATPRGLTKKGAKANGPSGAGIWASPTLDPAARLVYFMTGDNYSDPPTLTSDALLALNMDTGKLEWSKQYLANDAYNSSCPLPDGTNCPDSNGPDFDFGASAILIEKPRLLLIAQKSGEVRGVDPAKKGEIVWSTRIGKGGVLGGIQWGPASDGTKMYVALSDVAFTRRRIGGGNDIRVENDPKAGGGLFALRADNGERMWMAAPAVCGDRPLCSPAQSAAVTAMPGVVFSGAMDGHLRAYSMNDGKVIWDFDTVRDFSTVNGVPARGGGIDGGGAVIAGGMVFAGSGYAQFGGMPGNVVMAFSVEGR